MNFIYRSSLYGDKELFELGCNLYTGSICTEIWSYKNWAVFYTQVQSVPRYRNINWAVFYIQVQYVPRYIAINIWLYFTYRSSLYRDIELYKPGCNLLTGSVCIEI
jgi:hypothetical protein